MYKDGFEISVFGDEGDAGGKIKGVSNGVKVREGVGYVFRLVVDVHDLLFALKLCVLFFGRWYCLIHRVSGVA